MHACDITHCFPVGVANRLFRVFSCKVDCVRLLVTRTEYTLDELKKKPPPEGVDPSRLETYLNADDFQVRKKNLQLICLFARLFLRSFFRAFVWAEQTVCARFRPSACSLVIRSFLRACVLEFLCSFISKFVCSFFRSFVLSFGCSVL